MEVKEITVLTYRDGPQVQIPPGLIQQDKGGQKWLRVRASHHVIAKLILGHMQDFKTVKNPSLTSCPQIKILMDKIKDAVISAGEEVEGPDGEASLFDRDGENAGGEGSDGASEVAGYRMRQLLRKAPPEVKVSLGQQSVRVKTPSTWRESDIVVPLETNSLTAVADFIMEDVTPCFTSGAKRAYKQTGNFAKKKAKA